MPLSLGEDLNCQSTVKHRFARFEKKYVVCAFILYGCYENFFENVSGRGPVSRRPCHGVSLNTIIC